MASEVAPVSFDRVRALAGEFATSIQASAMRFVELTNERCAVVYLQRDRVLWAVKSPGFHVWIQDGRAVAPNSAASDSFDGGRPRREPHAEQAAGSRCCGLPRSASSAVT